MEVKPNLSLKQHFTTAKRINQLMCHLLGDVGNGYVLEPSVGHGAFLNGLSGQPARVDIVDIDDEAIRVVKSNFSHLPLEAYHEDFVDLFVAGLPKSSHPVRRTAYDFVISNPPYGLYFDLDYRKQIKRALPNVYARESYGLFFVLAVSQLRLGGRYVFLLPDTFLASTNHRPLREFICAHAAPTHIIRFPSKLFETVKFGYANLCIIAGHKKPLAGSDCIRWLNAFDPDQSLSIPQLLKAALLDGEGLLSNKAAGWSSSLDRSEVAAKSWRCLGDAAACKTGIYTGDNARFIGYDFKRLTRGRNGHPIDWVHCVHDQHLDLIERESGLAGQNRYVPLIRGGHREPFEETAWALAWTKDAVDFYRNNEKSRLQNLGFYFREGISVPMVTTKRISASLMRDSVFDQGVVGVFPTDAKETPALLLYLNSRMASQKIKAIVNGSANNSANYLKRLPVPTFNDYDIRRAENLVSFAKLEKSLPQEVCDNFVSSVIARYQDK